MTALFSGLVMVGTVIVLASRWPLAFNDFDLIYLLVGVLALAVLGREIADGGE